MSVSGADGSGSGRVAIVGPAIVVGVAAQPSGPPAPQSISVRLLASLVPP
jgi:hypothetical protein